jgi:hypothetical protein
MLHATGGGGGGFGTQWFHFLIVARLFGAVCLPELWSLPLVFFLTLSWVLSLYKGWQGFNHDRFQSCLNKWEICLGFWWISQLGSSQN